VQAERRGSLTLCAHGAHCSGGMKCLLETGEKYKEEEGLSAHAFRVQENFQFSLSLKNEHYCNDCCVLSTAFMHTTCLLPSLPPLSSTLAPSPPHILTPAAPPSPPPAPPLPPSASCFTITPAPRPCPRPRSLPLPSPLEAPRPPPHSTSCLTTAPVMTSPSSSSNCAYTRSTSKGRESFYLLVYSLWAVKRAQEGVKDRL